MKAIVKDIIIKREDCIYSTATLQDVVNKMAKNDTHHMVLIKDEKVIGIITERDIIHLYHDQVDFEISAIDYATLLVISMSNKRPLGYALSLMIDHGIRRIVTFDENKKYSGTVVQEELIFAYEEELFKGHTKVNELVDIKNKVVSITSNSTLANALDVMTEKNIGSILISDNSKAVGILTESDTLRLAQKNVSTDKSVKEFMHSPVLEIKWDAYVFEVIEFMRKNHIRHVLTHNQRDQYYVMSSKDILKNLKGNYSTFLESKLKDTRDTFNQISEAVIELTDLGDDQVISWLNRTAKNLLTVKIDSSICEIIPQNQWELIYNELKQKNKLSTQTISIEKKDFKLNVSISTIVGIDVIKILMTDITELTTYNKELYNQIGEIKKVAINKEKLFTEAFNQAAVGIFHVSRKNKIINSNIHASQLLGYSIDELIGQDIYDITYPDEIEITKKSYEKLWVDKTIENFSLDKRCRKKDGSTIWINVTTSLSLDVEDDKQYSICILADITDRKLYEQELTIAEEKYEKIVQLTPEVITVNRLSDGALIEVNDQGIEQAGYTREEWIGNIEIDKVIWKNSSDREKFLDILRNQRKISNFAHEFRVKSGEIRMAEVSASVVELNGEECYIAVFRDITRAHEQQIEILEQKEILENAQRIAHIGSWDLNLVSGELNWSDEVYRIFDIDKANNTPSYELLLEKTHPDDRENVDKTYTFSVEEKIVYDITHRIVTDQDKIKYVHERAEHKYDKDGKIIASVGTVQDITQVIRYEEELKQKEEMMMAQSRHAAMGEMIGMIAHQWRQPISVIAMAANNMLVDISFEDIDLEEFEKGATSIVDQTQHLSKTIEDFRNFFRPDNEKETVKLKSIIDESIEIFGASLKNSNIELIIDIQSDTVMNIHGRELLQVYINLIKNAKDALIENRDENRTITITLNDSDKYINTIICDNAGGIPSNIINKIFEPYFTTKDKKVGTGIGLHMSKTIIEKHMDGLLLVKNCDYGACFTVQLPK